MPTLEFKSHIAYSICSHSPTQPLFPNPFHRTENEKKKIEKIEIRPIELLFIDSANWFDELQMTF